MESVEPVAPPAPWLGGKKRLAEILTARIDAVPHDLYAEPFLGMGGVFFRRRRKPRLEVINDLGRDVANFFRVLQRHPAALLAELQWRVSSRAEFQRLLTVDPAALTDLERAARFYYLQRLRYSAAYDNGCFRNTEARFNIARQRRLLEKIHERLAGVLIECLPYQDLIAQYDRPGALFYLDPPYWGCERDYGKALFARADFDKLAGILKGLKGRFLLSLNDRPEVRRTFAGFHLEAVTTRYTVGDADAGADVAELIISDGPKPGDGVVAKQLGLL